MRKNLINARKEKNYTQVIVAKSLHISVRHYQRIEAGDCGTNSENWDALEDLFKVDQRELRAVSDEREAG